MATTAVPMAGDQGESDSKHWYRLLFIWLAISVVIDALWIFAVGPHVPPGRQTDSAAGQQFDIVVITAVALPVMAAVLTYFGYAIVVFRQRKDEPLTDGPPIRGDLKIQTLWITITTLVVTFMFVFGTYELIVPAGAGGAEGPVPIWTPSGTKPLVIQVIGQQWKFTYRYPSFGGFETNDLVIPANTEIAFHVTSLDVIHSFWAYNLGVKADANPSSDNVAFTKTNNQLGPFSVRCSELCGLWHGAMWSYGYEMSQSAFHTWALATATKLAKTTATLPPFAWTYTPDANGADGGYYPDTKVPYSPSQVYGAKQS